MHVLIGHSLGAAVALTLASAVPGAAELLVLEDPPAPNAILSPSRVAEEITISVGRARTDAHAEIDRLLTRNRLWARPDAVNAVRSRRQLDLDRVVGLLRRTTWDLPRLVQDCPAPVGVLAATRGSALSDPDRSTIARSLPDGRFIAVNSGHSIHRDRPGLWLQHVLRFSRLIR